jgi:hypothetical protein
MKDKQVPVLFTGQQCTFAFVISEHEAIYHSVHLQESVDFRDQGKKKTG